MAGGHLTVFTRQNASTIKLTVQDAGWGLGELSRHCGAGQPKIKGAPAERI